jgi:hypothetical protein
MASTTGTNGMALGNIPLNTLMLDKEAVVSVVEAQAEATMSGVQDIVDTAVSTVWKAGESKTAAQLVSSLLVAENEGYVYNLTTDATTTADWAEGAGKTILAGTDVAVINTGTAAAPVYKFNALAARDASVVRKVNGQTPGSDGAVTIPNAGASTNGLMTSGQYTKLSGIASGAEANQNAFAKIAVSGVAGTGDAASKTDTLTLVPGDNVTMSRSGKSVTINATVPSGVVTGVATDSGTASADSSGHVDIHGNNGVSVVVSGSSVIFVDGSSISGVASGAASGVTALSGVVSGLKNFSKVTVVNSGGTAVTNGTLTPASNADDTLKLQAGSNVTLSVTSGTKTVKIDASVPVKDGKISGGSSLLSGTTIVIPPAGSGAGPGHLGVVALDDYPEENNTIASGIAVAATPAAVATRVSKSVLDTNVTKVSADTQTPASYDTGNTLPNTIYGLIRAIKITNDTTN